MKYLKTFYFLFPISLIFLFSDNIFACSCMARSSVLEAFETSELVIIAKAVSVEMHEEAKGVDLEAQIKKAGYDNTDGYVKSVKMQVEKVYKGNVKVGDELFFGQGSGSDCIWTFGIKTVGKSFLFYLDKPTNGHPFFNDSVTYDKPSYFPITCGRSQNIVSYETDDLKYLNNLDKVKGKTRISGKFNCWYQDCPKFENLKIKIIGDKKTFQTQTDANGVYEIYDLPPGKYLIEPEVPKGWKINQRMLEYSPAFRQKEYIFYGEENDFSKQIPVVVEAGEHTGIDFFFETDTAIRGKVLSPDGKPMKGVCVCAVSTELKEGDYRGQSNCTNDAGVFEITEMSAGKYILVANKDGKISAKEPFGTLFYGNTFKYSEAKSFEVKLGEHLENLTIKVPEIEDLVTISGKLTYSNGVPVAEESIKLDADENQKKVDGDYLKTDKAGNFSFKILKGFQGRLFGEMYAFEYKFRNCPQYYPEIKKKTEGKDMNNLITPSVSIDATKDISNLVLKFDVAGCEQSR